MVRRTGMFINPGTSAVLFEARRAGIFIVIRNIRYFFWRSVGPA